LIIPVRSSLNLGEKSMKKTFAATVAAAALLASTAAGFAADLPVKARPYAVPEPIWTWTGFYIGAHVGAGWGTTESTLTGAFFTPPPTTVAFSFPFSQNSRSGFLGGAQAGYNWQSGWAVFGVQGDIAGTDIKGTTPCIVILSCTTKTDWLATVSGRLGAVVAERGLIYVKGGAAWMNSKHTVNLPFIAAPIVGQELTSRESTAWGWMLGMGTEWMITRNWTAFIEYDYIEFDKKNEGFPINPALLPPGTALTVNADLKNKLSIAKVGVNYKFDWGTPVVARY
jgi:outer membrane immunogenic protein